MPARPGISLDGEWRFVPDTERLFVVSDLPQGDPITVPGCWEAQVPRPYRIITAWYHRSFDVPPEWNGGTLLLSFGAVMYSCDVWLNGQKLGHHEGGYTPFAVEAPEDAVRWGAANEIAVEVQNPLNAIAEYPALAVERVLSAEQYVPDLPLSQAPHGKQTWYSSQSGLWQSVRAERVGNARFAALTVLPEVADSRARVRWRLAGLDTTAGLELDMTVFDADGAEVSRTRVPAGGDQVAGDATVPVPEPRLWDLDTPHLYRLEARLVRGDVEEDCLAKRFGMRTVGTADGAVTLNGRPIYVLGVLDQDLYPDTISTPPSVEFLREQVRRVKELGFNLLRCHIKVPDPAYLEVADEEGVLVWCELPNWTKFTVHAAARGRRTLERMVETMGDHPSIVIWTIINEDWGTQLRYERRDREWLRGTYEWLKELDPSRLVVDNSACETTETPNFHVRSDLADFHIYFGPDNAVRWRNSVSDFARRPAWLWSPHGDAEPRGDEPLIVSEFGVWGLPRLDRMVEHHGSEPWWFGTGQGYYRPSGIRRRFDRYGLDRIWSTIDDLADATQWHQFDSLQFEITEMRRHRSITGYVLTELSDAYWEANGVLDPMRGPKVFHDRFTEINAPDVVAIMPTRRDVWAGDSISGDVFLSSYSEAAASGGTVEWTLETDGAAASSGTLELAAWPRFDVADLGRIEIGTPEVAHPADARLTLTARDDSGRVRAESRMRFAILPRLGSRSASHRIAIEDPLGIWGAAERIAAIGHGVVSRAEADVVVTTQLTADLVDHADNGGRVLVLVRSESAIPPDLDLRRRVSAHLRRLPHAGWPGQRSPWEGDWVSNFNWVRPGAFPDLPERDVLDLAFEEVAPDHVLLGYDAVKHRDEVLAGMFVGWVHEPAALAWSFDQGAGSVLLTTFRVAPESGPVASTLLRSLIDHLAARPGPREDSPAAE
jgi:Glycosyl hydrolases family 2, sugar binding domain/Glycosyl hydrolases family 2/Glycosyl hydrolases family 2, TIM barrel domain